MIVRSGYRRPGQSLVNRLGPRFMATTDGFTSRSTILLPTNAPPGRTTEPAREAIRRIEEFEQRQRELNDLTAPTSNPPAATGDRPDAQ